MEEIVGSDCGRKNFKLVTRDTMFTMPSVLGEGRERKLNNQPLKHELEIEFNDQSYFVGELAEDESDYSRHMMVDTKAHEDTLILTLAALSRANIDEARLITGLPIGLHTEQNKRELKELLRGCHRLKVNQKEKIIVIRSVDVVAEGGGAFWSRPKDNLVRLIDGGSKTINYVTVKNRRFIDRDSGTLNFGFETNKTTNDKQLVAKIAAELGRNKWNEHDSIYTVGGKADVIAKEIQPYFKNVSVMPNALYANAIGFYQIGRMLYGI